MAAKCGLLACASVLGLVGIAEGSVIEQFDFHGNTGTETTVSASTIAAGVSGSAIARGPGLEIANVGTYDTNAFGGYPVTSVWGTSSTTAESKGEYFTFNITPSAGGAIALNNVVYAFISQNGTSVTYGNPAFNGTLEYSFDNSTFTPVSSQTDSVATGTANNPLIATVDTSGVAALQDVTTPVYFRIDLYNIGGYQPGGIGSSSGGSEDLILNGTVAAAPEPVSLGMMSLAALGLLARRRRMR